MNMDVVKGSSLSEGSLSAKQPALGNQCCPESVNAEPLQQKQVLVVGDATGLAETETVAPKLTGFEKCGQVLVSPCDNGQKTSSISEPRDVAKHLVFQCSETAQNDAVNTGGVSGLEHKTPVQSRKRRSTVALSVNNRVLRSRSQEKYKDSEPKDVVSEQGATEANGRKRRKKKQMRKMPVNQFSRIRSHLRYLLHRIKYEQNLIDAYSGEGWKGQSLEKIKPEKELQRAKSQIFRYKLKIRDLFQRIDMSLAEGKLPESVFDADGQIDSEDIFCAKCGSKDLTLDNDIILCDGACERGFHQFCLEPPLLREDIPPDEEGWLCPGCDCKVDCIEMLSDFQGSDLSVLDQWEKVFPEEAAAAASGMKMDDYSGLPSDDSEDDDYDPDKPERDHMVLGDESSSDGSEYFSASDDHMTAVDNKHILGLPSDDSEDDDFDPCAPDDSNHAKDESSSSDFTSDSEGEDFGVISPRNESLGNKQQRHIPPVLDQNLPEVGCVGEKLKVGRVKRESLRDELSYLLQSNDAPISAKRHVERLNYQKLHHETYGDTSSDSSDEDYGKTACPKSGKNSTRKATPLSTNVPPRINDGGDTKDENHSQKDCANTLNMKSDKILEVGSSTVFAESESTPSEGGSTVKSSSRPYKRLDEGVVQRLLESFRENQYPKQGVKESLAKELGLRIQQVSKWFENARWSSRHSFRMEAKMAGNASANGTCLPQISEVPELGPKSVVENASRNGQTTPCAKGGCSDGVPEAKSANASSLKSRKRRNVKVDDQNVGGLSSIEKTPRQDSHGDTSKCHSARRSSRLQARNSN